MKTHTFLDGGTAISVSKVRGHAEVAVWATHDTASTIHITPKEARRMAKVLKKSARRAEAQIEQENSHG